MNAKQFARWVGVGALLAAISSLPAAADGILLAGSTFPMRNCRIQSILGGQVVYTDPSGQRQQRSLDDIATLSFDQLQSLDEAEKLIAERDLAAGARRLMQALLEADTDLQRQWIHSRLARIHDARGEYVQAAGHAAAVMAANDEAYWARLEPVSQPNEPSYPAAKESLEHLQKAARAVKSAALTASVGRMLKTVQPIHDRLKRDYAGPAIEPGSTVSGISRAALMGADAEPKPVEPSTSAPAQPLRENSAPNKATNPVSPPAPPSVPHEPNTPVAIDVLLREKKFAEAVTACNRAAATPGDRDLPQFLFQYGSALLGVDRSEDAAVMFVRCAVLYPTSTHAASALVRAAIIHRDTLQDTPAARRLLERAVTLAEAADQPNVVTEARQALQSLDSGQSPSKEP